MLAGLVTNTSEMQPSLVQADPPGQRTAICGLAHRLSMQLRPRSRNWKERTRFRPSKTARSHHLASLFDEPSNWRLSEPFRPDLLRMGMSIKAGKLTPSTILRRLGAYSRKNRWSFALRELGRAIRPGFLLPYLSDADLRRLMLRSLNKSELLKGFLSPGSSSAARASSLRIDGTSTARSSKTTIWSPTWWSSTMWGPAQKFSAS
jgi:TnpA family transposase